MFGSDPKQLAQMMKQFGIKTQDIAASRVVIEKVDGSKIVVEKPSVVAIDMKGQKMFQVSGSVKEAAGEETGEEPAEEEAQEEGKFTEKDVEMVAQQAKASKDDARKALEKTNGDIAEAILLLEEG